jgi:methylmalonyl-CoA/ethylmalonyl-CoA epimerase
MTAAGFAPLELHHVGCAVSPIGAAIDLYEQLGFRRRSRIFEVTEQLVRVCFVELGPATYLELVEPTGPDSPAAHFTATGFYHLCFLVDDLDAAEAFLDGSGLTPLRRTPSEAFAGNPCQFFMTADGHLLECAEMTRAAFDAFFAASAG